jgi:NADH-ubiquinone oxidoreductase chain 5
MLGGSAILTAAYSIRLLEQVFWEDFNGFKSIVRLNIRPSNVEIAVLALLAVFSLFSGFILRDIFIGLGSDFSGAAENGGLAGWAIIETEVLSYVIKLVPLLAVLAFDNTFWLFECKWFYNEVVNFYIALPVLKYGRHAFEQIEKGVFEAVGPLYFYEVIRQGILGR